MRRFIVLLSSLTVSFLSLAPMNAQAQDAAIVLALAKIEDKVSQILTKVNNIPDFIQTATQFFLNWGNTQDRDNNIGLNGALLNLYMNSYTIDENNRIDYTNTLTKYFYNGTPATDANDYSYTTLLGKYLNSYSGANQQTQINKSIANYMQFVSGNGFNLTPPENSWQKGSGTRRDYYSLYKTLVAAQSYNNYIISKLYVAQQQNAIFPKGIPAHPEGTAATTADILAATVAQATSPTWYQDVGAETLGLVLRQILIYNSQIYVLLTRMLELQQQMLASQAVANSLTMTSISLGTGRLLYQRAEAGQN